MDTTLHPRTQRAYQTARLLKSRGVMYIGLDNTLCIRWKDLWADAQIISELADLLIPDLEMDRSSVIACMTPNLEKLATMALHRRWPNSTRRVVLLDNDLEFEVGRNNTTIFTDLVDHGDAELDAIYNVRRKGGKVKAIFALLDMEKEARNLFYHNRVYKFHPFMTTSTLREDWD